MVFAKCLEVELARKFGKIEEKSRNQFAFPLFFLDGITKFYRVRSFRNDAAEIGLHCAGYFFEWLYFSILRLL